MESCLKAYGFPNKYIEWIKTLYNDLTASIMVNGFTTDTFKVLRSVKQGDALSCALFVICIDPLLRAIERSTQVKMIQIVKFDNFGSVKTLSYADDITVICKDLDSIQEVLNIYNTFSKLSGIELNIPKTEIIKIGCRNTERITTLTITYDHERHDIITQEHAKICGLYFSPTPDIAYQHNITAKIDKFQTVINLWRTRNLTIIGKIIIIKSLGLSQLTASIQQTIIKTDDLKRIDQAITRFIWNKSNTSRPSGLIANALLKAEYQSGGLKSPDIYSINDSIKLKNLIRTLHINHPVSSLYAKILEENKKHMDYNPFKNTAESNITAKLSSTYILQAHHVHRCMSSKIESDLKLLSDLEPDTKMHKNYHIIVHNDKLATSSYINPKQENVVRRLKNKNINTFSEVCRLRTDINNPIYNTIAIELHQVFHSYPKWWHKIYNKTNRNYQNQYHTDTNIGLNRWINSTKIKSSQIRSRLMENSKHQNAFDRVKNNAGIELAEANNPFTTLRKVTNITQLRIIQYKSLMGIHPTRSLLHKWGVVENDRCDFCQQKENTAHITLDCDIATDTYQNLIQLLETIEHTGYDQQIDLSREGIVTLYNLPPDVATLVILIKGKLLSQKENKAPLSQNAIIAIAQSQHDIEKRMAYNLGKIPRHNKKWAFLSMILSQSEA